jgi:hypothetical protein
MRSNQLASKLAMVGLLAAASCSPPGTPTAQPAKTNVFVYHTRPSGGCPGLDWHIVTEPDGSLMGFVAWDRMRHMARLEGKINPDRSFKMDAKEMSTGRIATVTGTATGDYIMASINGSGTACDDKMLQIPRDDGGLEGGGG